MVDWTAKVTKEKPTWGYDRMSSALSNVGYHITDTTIGNILKAHGIEQSAGSQTHGIICDIHEVALGRDGFDRLHDY